MRRVRTSRAIQIAVKTTVLAMMESGMFSLAPMTPSGKGGAIPRPPPSGSVKPLENVVSSAVSALDRRCRGLDRTLRLRPERTHVLGDHDRGCGRDDADDCQG